MSELSLYGISVWVLPILLAVTLHEAAHGYAAWVLGDDTAHRLGRVTMNPLRHVDPVGTVLIPATLLIVQSGILFGWAKPVPVNFARLDRPRRDMVLVAAAGPLTNLAIAAAAAWLLRWVHLLPDTAIHWTMETLANAVLINVVLAVFNLLPLPPLDGGRIAVGLLPRALAVPLAKLERFGFLILLAALLILPRLGQELGVDLNVFHWLIYQPTMWIIDQIVAVMGLG